MRLWRIQSCDDSMTNGFYSHGMDGNKGIACRYEKCGILFLNLMEINLECDDLNEIDCITEILSVMNNVIKWRRIVLLFLYISR